MEKDMKHLLRSAKEAALAECKDCPRSLSMLGNDERLFASCCKDHYSLEPCLVMFIYRDPSRSKVGCAKDNLICCYCHDDQTALNHRKLMEHYKIDTKQIYNTNAVLCGSRSKNSAPSTAVIRKCSKVLRRQIELINPGIIVTFGLEAVKTTCLALDLDAPKRMSDVAGREIQSSGPAIFPTYHLSPLNYNTNKKGSVIERHWQYLSSILPKK